MATTTRAHYEIFRDKAGEWRWHLRADNGRIIATSGEGYKRVEDAIAGTQLVADLASSPVKGDVERKDDS